MITGKEALIALANGETVEMTDSEVDMPWTEICVKNNDFFGKVEPCPWMFINTPEHIQFRLKPRTISINGIEVPCCGENYKEGEEVYVLDDCCDERGYIEYSVSGHNFEGLLPKLWWRTEEEIKQVVSALRSVFKGGA